jgi:hypothetical protein
MLSQLEGRKTDRKVRLFAAACGRVILDELTQVATTFREFDPPNPVAVIQTAEDHADDPTAVALEAANRHARQTADLCARHMHFSVDSIYRSILPRFRLLAWITTERVGGLAPAVDPGTQCRLLRCVFYNPFRPVTADPSWFTSTVTALAHGIYVDRAFDRLPIFADALQDTGCNHDDLLNHCRGSGPHARGCWVVDLVLGKS